MSIKALIVYHKNCIDGITAAAVTWKHCTENLGYSSKEIETLPMQYGNSISVIPMLNRLDCDLYIVDFSLPIADIRELSECYHDIYIYDHHETAYDKLLPNSRDEEGATRILDKECMIPWHPDLDNVFITFDNNQSGASLCWGAMFPESTVPRLVRYVEDYDLWRFFLQDTKAINKYLRTFNKTIEDFLLLLDQLSTDIGHSTAINTGTVLLVHEDRLENEFIESYTCPITINGKEGLACNAPHYFASGIGHKLAKKCGTFGAVWCQHSSGGVVFSLRSEGDYSVRAIAESCGGGGHNNAAGFKWEIPEFNPEEGITLWHPQED